MRKVLVLLVLILTAALPLAAQNLVQNPGFEASSGTPIPGWTNWFCTGWGSGMSVEINTSNKVSGANSARLRINNGSGSFGIYQVVSVTPNVLHNFSTWVRATSNTSNWAEVLLFNYQVTNTGDIDSGTISRPYLIWKRDSWGGVSGVPGGSLPTIASNVPPYPGNSWEYVTGTVSSPTGYVTIAYKWGNGSGGFSGSMYVDEVSLTAVPEPGSLLALSTGIIGLAGIVIRRRR
ncbi:MAG: PEP-CTERM sorting domain-containing protein [Armatimonadetes bacterium]|nr:PEP-CTERM sorting domain-containing protein [Armatimonadota bacterium]